MDRGSGDLLEFAKGRGGVGEEAVKCLGLDMCDEGIFFQQMGKAQVLDGEQAASKKGHAEGGSKLAHGLAESGSDAALMGLDVEKGGGGTGSEYEGSSAAERDQGGQEPPKAFDLSASDEPDERKSHQGEACDDEGSSAEAVGEVSGDGGHKRAGEVGDEGNGAGDGGGVIEIHLEVDGPEDGDHEGELGEEGGEASADKGAVFKKRKVDEGVAGFAVDTDEQREEADA